MARILHIADFHLDSPLSALPPDKSAERRTEMRASFGRVIRFANERDVDILLIAGDLFDTSVYRETVDTVASWLRKAKARVFIAPGNHDYYGSPIYDGISFGRNVHIFKTQSIERVEIPELNLDIYGAAFTSKYCTHSMLAGFKVADPSRINLMVMHGDLNQPNSRYNPVYETDISASGLTYLALGHAHNYSGVKQASKTSFAHPGCVEGRGFDEEGERGIIAGDITSGAVKLSFVPISKRNYTTMSADVSSMNEEQACETILRRAANPDRIILRLIVEGVLDKPGFSCVALEALLRKSFYHAVCHDHTQLKMDIWAQAGADNLTGQFLADMRGRFEAAEDSQDKRRIELAVKIGLSALDGREEPQL